MGVRIVGVPVVHRQPLEAGPHMALEARHGLADKRTEFAEIGAILKEFGVPIVDESYAAQKP